VIVQVASNGPQRMHDLDPALAQHVGIADAGEL
jgi:hypothetical protein